MCCFSIILFPNLSTYFGQNQLIHSLLFFPKCLMAFECVLCLSFISQCWQIWSICWHQLRWFGEKGFPKGQSIFQIFCGENRLALVTHIWHINTVEIDCMHMFLNYICTLYFPDCSWFKPCFSALNFFFIFVWSIYCCSMDMEYK